MLTAQHQTVYQARQPRDQPIYNLHLVLWSCQDLLFDSGSLYAATSHKKIDRAGLDLLVLCNLKHMAFYGINVWKSFAHLIHSWTYRT